MAADLIFSSEWLKDEDRFQEFLDGLQVIVLDRMAEKNANMFIVTTTRDMDTGARNYWAVESDYEDSLLFYKDMMNNEVGTIDIFEDDDNCIFARYKLGDRSSIWKFHFIQDIEHLIDNTITHLGSYYFDDFRDTMEYTLQDGDYLNYNEELSIELIEDGLGADFSMTLPYMQEPIIHGILYYDNHATCWMLEEGTVSFDDVLDIYVEECLY